MKLTATQKSILVIFLILFIDQLLKIWVKTNMEIGEDSFYQWDWWSCKKIRLRFVENNGMAFGWIIPLKYGKIILSSFRIFAVGGILWYLKKLIEKKAPIGYILSISMIFAGAFGNIIDSMFYGLIFNAPIGETATLFPAEGGYSSFLYGRVVDMLYFPVWDSGDFIFFRPIFNIADSAITIGVSIIILFHRKYVKENY